MHSCGMNFCQNRLGNRLEEWGSLRFTQWELRLCFHMMDPSWQDFLRDAVRCWHYLFLHNTDWNERTNWTPSHAEDTVLGLEWLQYFFLILTFVTSVMILNNVKHVVPPQVTSQTCIDWPSLDWLRKTVFQNSAMSLLSFRRPFYYMYDLFFYSSSC